MELTLYENRSGLLNYIKCGEILNTCWQVKEVQLKRLYLMTHDTLEKAKLGGKEKFQWFPGIGGWISV